MDIAEAWTDLFWNYLTKDTLKSLRFKVAPLLRFVPGVEIAAATFTSKEVDDLLAFTELLAT